MSRNAHAARNLQLLRDNNAAWYDCHECGASYQSRNARVLCCSHDPNGGDGR